MEQESCINILDEIQKHVNFDEAAPGVIAGNSITGDMQCPYCGGKALYHLYPHNWGWEKGLGIISYCETKECYSLRT